MSTDYPVLNNRPIDQWKVTELKEELKKRKLPVKGLKEELIKRLDDDMRSEEESFNEVEAHNGFNPDSDVQNIDDGEEAELMADSNHESAASVNKETSEDAFTVEADDKAAVGIQGVEVDRNLIDDKNSDVQVIVAADNAVSVDDIKTVAEDDPETAKSKNAETVEDVPMVDAEDRAGVAGQVGKVEDGKVSDDSSLDGPVAVTADNAVSVDEIETVAEDKLQPAKSKRDEIVEVVSMVGADDRDGVAGQGVNVEGGNMDYDSNLERPAAVTADNVVSVDVTDTVAGDSPEATESKTGETFEDVSMVDADDRAGVSGQGVEGEAGNVTDDPSLDGSVAVSDIDVVSKVDTVTVVTEFNSEVAESKSKVTAEDSSKIDTGNNSGVVNQDVKVQAGSLNDEPFLDGPVAASAINVVSKEDTVTVVTEYNSEVLESKNKVTVEDSLMVDAEDKSGVVNQGVNVEAGSLNDEPSLDGLVAVTADIAVSVETIEIENQSVITQIRSSCQDLHFGENLVDSNSLIEDSTLNSNPNINETNNQSAVTQSDMSGQDSGFNEKYKDSNPPAEDATLSSIPNNQVPEVSHDLGFQIKCESISNNYVSINNNKLKDNLNANDFHLELQVFKSEMVQPSSGSVPSVGDIHMLDDDEGPGKDQVSLDERDAKCATTVELSKNEDTVDGDSPEKLSLDKSPGNEFMEEDVLKSKNIESNSKSSDLGEGAEVNNLHDDVDGGTLVNVTSGRLSPDSNNIAAEEKVRPTAPNEKRKIEDHEVKTSDSSKRQRRWNPVTIKAPEVQLSNISSSSTLNDILPPVLQHRFARSDSTLSLDSPKERYVPPSRKPATTSLRIDRFLRPFTLKAVQELLAKTGTICQFWIDQIKTHCYVTYSSVEEAAATRNAVYNLQWPPNGGRLLVADFVDPHEVKIRAEGLPQSSVPPSPTTPKAPILRQPQAPQAFQQQLLRQQLPPPPPLPPPPSLSDPPSIKERLPPPPVSEPPSVRERLQQPPRFDPPTVRERLPPPPRADPPIVREQLPPPPKSDPPSARDRLPPPPSDLPTPRERLPPPPSDLPTPRERLPPPPPPSDLTRAREGLPPPLSDPPITRERLPPPPSDPPIVRERLPPPPSDLLTPRERLPPPPPPPKKPEPLVLTLDDLFKKTRATPRIYYLPLSEEQVAAKLAAEGKKSTP